MRKVRYRTFQLRCILDWGLVQDIEPDLQLTLIEHVAHITAKDYAAIPEDLVRLGFVPEGQEEAVRQAGIADFIAYAYGKRAEGGGFATWLAAFEAELDEGIARASRAAPWCVAPVPSAPGAL